MRAFYAIVLLLFVAAVGLFAFQNQEAVTLNFVRQNLSSPLALVVGVVYLLGMLSGWTVVGFLRRGWHEVADR